MRISIFPEVTRLVGGVFVERNFQPAHRNDVAVGEQDVRSLISEVPPGAARGNHIAVFRLDVILPGVGARVRPAAALVGVENRRPAAGRLDLAGLGRPAPDRRET